MLLLFFFLIWGLFCYLSDIFPPDSAEILGEETAGMANYYILYYLAGGGSL